MESQTNLDAILEHIQKPKKLVLPKGYVRKQVTNVDILEIQDNLTTDSFTTVNVTKKNLQESTVDAKIEPLKTKAEKKTRTPTAYNIYVKQTVITLQETHKHLKAKERFQLAIKMWGESKTK